MYAPGSTVKSLCIFPGVFGESCASNSECDNEMKCISSKCACETNTQHVVRNVISKNEDNCVHKDGRCLSRENVQQRFCH